MEGYNIHNIHQDEVRTVPRADLAFLDEYKINEYIRKRRINNQRLSEYSDNEIRELINITSNGIPTLASVMLFSLFPQVYFPQFSINAVRIRGTYMGELGPDGERFADNRRIEGTIPEMLEDAMRFYMRNTGYETVYDSVTGEKYRRYEYPEIAVREAVLNALVHRDYSIYGEGRPISMEIYNNRIEICSPGMITGGRGVKNLGAVKPDTRNPEIATALEFLDITQNRYSGIPIMKKAMRDRGLLDPVFRSEDDSFTVILYNKKQGVIA